MHQLFFTHVQNPDLERLNLLARMAAMIDDIEAALALVSYSDMMFRMVVPINPSTCGACHTA
jgi:hypothetical protein